jgi:hypothetical protein
VGFDEELHEHLINLRSRCCFAICPRMSEARVNHCVRLVLHSLPGSDPVVLAGGNWENCRQVNRSQEANMTTDEFAALIEVLLAQADNGGLPIEGQSSGADSQSNEGLVSATMRCSFRMV